MLQPGLCFAVTQRGVEDENLIGVVHDRDCKLR